MNNKKAARKNIVAYTETMSAVVLVTAFFCFTAGSPVWAGVGVWTKTGSVSQKRIVDLLLNPADSHIMYAATMGEGVFKSTDQGATWTAKNAGLSATPDAYGYTSWSFLFMYAAVIDPSSPDTIYAGSYQGGVLKTVNGGESWFQVNNGLGSAPSVYSLALDPNSGTLYAGADTGLYRSVNGGGFWSVIDSNLFAAAIAVDPRNSNNVYVGTMGSGIYKSANAGISFIASNTGLNALNVYSIAVLDSATLVIGTNSGLYRSADHGATWSLCAFAGKTVLAEVVIDPIFPRTLYAGIFDLGVYKSLDNGVNWTAINTGLDNFRVDSLTVDHSAPTFYAGGVESSSVTSPAGGVYAYTTPPPSITEVFPDKAMNSGGPVVTIKGTGFNNGAVTTFGVTASTSAIVVSDTELTVTVPPQSRVGYTDIKIKNLDNQETATKTNALIYYQPVAVTAGAAVAAMNGVTHLIIGSNAFNTSADIVGATILAGIHTADSDTANAGVDNTDYKTFQTSAGLENTVTRFEILDHTLTTAVPYTKGLTARIPYPASITENTAKFLRITALNETSWTLVEAPQTIDPVNTTVSTDIYSNGLYRALKLFTTGQNLDQVTVFPNPVNFSAAVRGTCKFKYLSADPTIKIYTLDGQLVRQIEPGYASGAIANDGLSGLAEWDGTNETGEKVARGLYYYLITDGEGHKKIGKIGVIK
ncbi:MAG: IPT/TIG domain-containing protein [Elusimicrobia bacterium]|nr:IPT/TIG domain-containing protein [Elusimicrobiota bacterium]